MQENAGDIVEYHYEILQNDALNITLILQGIADQKYPLKKPTAMVVYSYSDSDWSINSFVVA